MIFQSALKSISFFYLILIASFSYSQDHNPEEILEKVKKAFEVVEDYTVNVKIVVDVNFLKMPETTAKIYFKKPDKIHFESEGFALLPKEGLNFSPNSLLSTKHTSIYNGEDTLNGSITSVIKIIPLEESGNLVLSTLWIDKNNFLIRKIESTTKTNGTYSIDLFYDKGKKYPLPDKMVFSFNLSGLNLPKGMGGELPDKEQQNKDERTKGTVTIFYSDYIVNQGLSNSVFDEKKQK
ncbi:MAG: hypothetical protein Kow0098_13570 [Ignavibacteriaceae bacterium]